MLEFIIYGLIHEGDWDLTQPQATLLAGVISGVLLIVAAYIAFHGQREQRAAERQMHEEQLAEQRRKAAEDLEAQRIQLVEQTDAQRRQLSEQLDAQRSQFTEELKARERMWNIEADRSAALVLRNEYMGMFASHADQNARILSSLMNAQRHHSRGHHDKALESIGETNGRWVESSAVPLVLSASDLINARYADLMKEFSAFTVLFAGDDGTGLESVSVAEGEAALTKVREANQRFNGAMRAELDRLFKQGLRN